MENFPHADPNTPVKERRNPGLRIGFSNSYYQKYPAGILLENNLDITKKGQRSAAERLARDAAKNTQPGEEGMPRIKIHKVVYEAPYYETWPPEHHTRILFASPLRDSNEPAYVRAVVQRFMTRAYRRPATEAEVDRLMKVYDDYRPQVDSIVLALREVLPEVLVSPEFLYLLEATGDSARQPLTDYELASRLSYLFWSTMPSDELFEAAESGKLQDNKFLEQATRKMLADPRSWNFVSNFTDQWLKLDELDRIAINPEFYPDFDSRLKRDMRLETQHFLRRFSNGI